MTRTRISWRPARPGGHFDEFDPTKHHPCDDRRGGDGWGEDEAWRWTDDERHRANRPITTNATTEGTTR